MNLHVFCIHISIMLLLQCTLSRTLLEANEIDSEFEENEKSDETEAIHEARHRSLKHPKDSHMKKHNRKRREFDEASMKKKQCAIMYKNDEPVGILQAFKDSYQLLPIHSDESIPVDINPMQKGEEANKRDTEAQEELGDDTAADKSEEFSQFVDEKYPYIFAKFKIDSKIERESAPKMKSLQKRESKRQSLFSQNHVNSLRSTLSRIESNDEGAEADLRDILNDMGLIDDSRIDKREADLIEDEDLEHGTNKINLIRIENKEEQERPKRADSSKKHAKAVTKHYEMIEIPEPKSINEDEYIDQYINKHPEEFNQNEKKEREKRAEDVAAQMERQIKERLLKIKEEVRNEIENIKANSNEDFEEEDEEKEEEDNIKSQRKKRNAVNTLVDEETSDLDPILVGENNLVPHIRRRRSLDEDDIAATDKDDTTENVNDKLEDVKMEADKTSLHEENVKSNAVINNNEEHTSIYKEGNLIIDLNPEIFLEKDSQKSKHRKRESHINLAENYLSKKKVYDEVESLNENSDHESVTSTNQYFATSHFVLRNLKEYKGETNNDYDDLNEDLQIDEENSDTNADSDETSKRKKKACKCGKDCKCDRPAPPKPLVGEDGSNFVYFDGAPVLAVEPFVGVVKGTKGKDAEVASLKLLPLKPNKKRQSRQEDNVKLAKIETKILRGLRDGGYTLDLDPDIYRITDQNPHSLEARRKRNAFVDLVAIHGGGPVLDHLIAVRERSMLPPIRPKRSIRERDQTEQQLTLTDMSGEDLFGALPQSYEGELARYKRVKRAN